MWTLFLLSFFQNYFIKKKRKIERSAFVNLSSFCKSPVMLNFHFINAISRDNLSVFSLHPCFGVSCTADLFKSSKLIYILPHLEMDERWLLRDLRQFHTRGTQNMPGLSLGQVSSELSQRCGYQYYSRSSFKKQVLPTCLVMRSTSQTIYLIKKKTTIFL